MDCIDSLGVQVGQRHREPTRTLEETQKYPKLTAWSVSCPTVKFKGVTLRQITRGGKEHRFADDRAEGKFCGIGSGTAWVAKTVNASGRLADWDSGVK